MILAIFGLWNLIIGIRAVAAASYYVDETSITGKFDFCYQWRNSEVSATAWRNLRMEGYKQSIS